VSYTADALNRYTQVGGVAPTYDGNGNLTFDGTFTLGYDAENRLVSASGAGNTASYGFDAQGRRKSKTVNGVTTIFVTDADNCEVLEYDGASGQVQRWYAYGLGLNDVLNQTNVPTSTRATFLPDMLGSIIGVLDSAGALTKIGYAPYGAPSNTAGPFRFTSQRIDPEAGGVHYYRARMYSTTWGRFLQTDPVRLSASINLYSYTSNDPFNFIAPMGLTAEAVGTESSIAQSLLQGTINLIPGAFYGHLAQQEFRAGNYASSAIYGAVSLGDAALGIATFGISSRIGAAIREGFATAESAQN
jgi:RHS repeat-associated protein